jgi:hygromycin-B 4-O-kinase
VTDSPSDVDVVQAASFLALRFGEDVTDVEFLADGSWSRCFGFRNGGAEFVARFGRHLEDFERDQRASAFASSKLPIPIVSEVGEAFGAWFAISTRSYGTPWEELGASEWVATAPSVLATLDALRLTDLSGTTGFGEWDRTGNAPHATWRGYLASVADDQPERRTFGWRQMLSDSSFGDATFGVAYDQMLALAESYPGGRHLVHNDLLYRNALAADGRVTALFDWGCSIYGDFLYDLALLHFWSPWFPALDALHLVRSAKSHLAATDVEVPEFDARFRCCALHIGLVHLGYNAFVGDEVNLRLTDERMRTFMS